METECAGYLLIVSVLACRIGVSLARWGGSPLSGRADGDLLGAQVVPEPLPPSRRGEILSDCLFTSCFRTEESSREVGRWL